MKKYDRRKNVCTAKNSSFKSSRNPWTRSFSRVKQIIARRNTEFILDHQNDSLEQLSAYLKACMEDIGHPPARVEVIGGDFLEYRFESWPKALRSFYSGSVSANLKNPPPFANRKIVRDLYAALDSQRQRADAACTKEVRA